MPLSSPYWGVALKDGAKGVPKIIRMDAGLEG
jgi:hypothetical protein